MGAIISLLQNICSYLLSVFLEFSFLTCPVLGIRTLTILNYLSLRSSFFQFVICSLTWFLLPFTLNSEKFNFYVVKCVHFNFSFRFWILIMFKTVFYATKVIKISSGIYFKIFIVLLFTFRSLNHPKFLFELSVKYLILSIANR